MRTIYRKFAIFVLALLIPAAQVNGQKVHTPEGDTPENAGPLATDVSPALTPEAIAKAMRKVGDWELARSRPDFSQDWTYAALYRGFLAAAKSLPDDQYRDAMVDVGKKFDWKLGPRTTEADDQAIGYIVFVTLSPVSGSEDAGSHKVAVRPSDEDAQCVHRDLPGWQRQEYTCVVVGRFLLHGSSGVGPAFQYHRAEDIFRPCGSRLVGYIKTSLRSR